MDRKLSAVSGLSSSMDRRLPASACMSSSMGRRFPNRHVRFNSPFFIQNSLKPFGSTVEFTRQRNADIMRVFRQKLAEADVIRMDDICRQVADSPSSRFWVSAERAAIVISAMEAGRDVPCMTQSKREMFAEIFRRYLQLRTLHPGVPVLRLAAIIVTQPAPKFYFTPRTVREFICRIRNGYYDRRQDSPSHHSSPQGE